jgi:drug/metabolite transporter (DMT)-like permease
MARNAGHSPIAVAIHGRCPYNAAALRLASNPIPADVARMTPPPPDAATVPSGKELLEPYSLLVLSMLMWAGNWVLGRAVHDAVAPSALAFWRWALAALILLPIAGRSTLRHWPTIRRRWAFLLVLSLTGAALSHWLVYTGLRHTTAINALLINSTLPACIIVLSWLGFRETVTRRQLVGLVLSFVGVIVIVTRGDPTVLSELRFNIGDLAIFSAMIPMAIYPIMLRHSPPELGSIETLLVIAVLSALLLAPVFVYDTFFGIQTIYTMPVIGSIGYIVVVATVVAFLCFNRGVAAVGANRSGFFTHLLPVFGTAMAVLFLGESVQPFHGVGIATIFAGVFLSTVAIKHRAMP